MSDLKFLLLAHLIYIGGIQGSDDDECPPIITRRNWGAARAEHVDYQLFPISYVIIAHTVSNTCDSLSICADMVRGIQNYHKTQLDYYDIGYNFLIGNDGNVYEGVGWHIQGAHTYGWNSRSTGIAFLGDFSESLPSQAALDACKKLMECGVQTGELASDYKLLGHLQLIATQSPGQRLYHEIQTWNNWASKP